LAAITAKDGDAIVFDISAPGPAADAQTWFKLENFLRRLRKLPMNYATASAAPPDSAAGSSRQLAQTATGPKASGDSTQPILPQGSCDRDQTGDTPSPAGA
jgi:hypothetical protein